MKFHLLYEIAPIITDLLSIRILQHLLIGPHNGRFTVDCFVLLSACLVYTFSSQLHYTQDCSPSLYIPSALQVLSATMLFASGQDSCCTCSEMIFEPSSFH